MGSSLANAAMRAFAMAICALIGANTANSLTIPTKAGYTLEGLMRRSAIEDGEVLDQYLFAAYADRWHRGPRDVQPKFG